MKAYEIKFVLNNTYVLLINLDLSIEELDCCYRIPVCLIGDSRVIILSNNTVQSDLQSLRNALMQALADKLVLHPSINDDIGYLYNEYYQNRSKYIEVPIGGKLPG